MPRKREVSKAVKDAVSTMFAKMAEAAAKKAVEMAGSRLYSFHEADDQAERACAWAERAGARAIHWRLGL